MNNSGKIDPYGFREYDARWVYEKDIDDDGIVQLGKGLGTQIINHTKKNNPRISLAKITGLTVNISKKN